MKLYDANRILDELRARCKSENLTLCEVASKAGYTQERLSAYFNYVHMPRIDVILKLAQVLNYEVYLSKGKDKTFRPVEDRKRLYDFLDAYRKTKDFKKDIERHCGRQMCFYVNTLHCERSMRLDVLVDLLEVLGLRLYFKPVTEEVHIND